ncbi:MAG: Glu-tRNA(Gln) amidotransferase subunit GatD [Candidatus Micrarchaeota archaeon]
MYPSSLEKLFKSKKIEIGDRIKVLAGSNAVEGRLMPRSYESEIIVLKLDNGYNIGLNSVGAKIELVSKGMKKQQKIQKNDVAKGEFAILGCGGTISSKVEYSTGAVYPAISAQELKAAFPSLDKFGSVYAKQIFSLFSEDFSSYHWKVIADAIYEEVKSGAKGVVLMHGTDTMHYSSAAISFMLQNLPVPVVFVGSQRSSDRPSSENEMNLLNSLYSARQGFNEVAICMHATINDDYCYLHRGTRVRKMHTSRRDAFESINLNPLAKVDHKNNVFEKLSEFRKPLGKLTVSTNVNENVAMIYAHPNLSSKLISKLDDYDGVVLMGTGLGHVSTNPFGDKHAKSVLKSVKELVDSDIPVVMAPQTISGRLNLNVYTTGRLLKDAGVIGDGMDWTPETAFVKLSWVLGQTKNIKKVKEMMETNIAGEISERSVLL